MGTCHVGLPPMRARLLPAKREESIGCPPISEAAFVVLQLEGPLYNGPSPVLGFAALEGGETLPMEGELGEHLGDEGGVL